MNSNSKSAANTSDILRLISEVVKLNQVRSRKDNDELAIRTAYRPLLRALIDNNGVTQLGLVAITGLKAPTVSITLRAMESEGLVTRHDDEIDLRRTHVYITDMGRAKVVAMEESDAKLCEDILNGFTDEDSLKFVRYLNRLKENLSIK